MTDLERVTALCRQLGATTGQAERMASQLLKRADQLARERSCSRLDALEYLLRLTTQGAQGEPPPEFKGGLPPEAADSEEGAERPAENVDDK